MDQSEKVRENRLREVAKRRGYELSKSRRRDPLAVDFGKWYLTRGSMEGPGGGKAPMGTVTLESLDSVESFLDGKIGPPTPEERGER
jgi:hypothetical protein